MLAAATLAGLLAAGCAGPEKKLGRGMRNTLEIARLGEMNRSIEQAALFGAPDIEQAARHFQALFGQAQ